MNVMRRLAVPMTMKLACVLFAGTLSGCGLKGPLYLPEQASGIVTRPTQSPPEPANAPNSPQTVDSPAGGATPAPEVTAPDASTPADASAAGDADDQKDADKKDKGAAPTPR